MRSCGLNTLRGASSTAMRSAICWKARAASLSGATAAIGRPESPPFAQLGHQRELGEERDAELVGELLATTGAEQLVALAVVAR